MLKCTSKFLPKSIASILILAGISACQSQSGFGSPGSPGAETAGTAANLDAGRRLVDCQLPERRKSFNSDGPSNGDTDVYTPVPSRRMPERVCARLQRQLRR